MFRAIMIDSISFIFLLSFIVIAALWVLVPALYGLPPVTTRRERIRRALQMANLQPPAAVLDMEK